MKEGYGDGCKDTLFPIKESMTYFTMTDFTTPVDGRQVPGRDGTGLPRCLLCGIRKALV